MHPIKFLWNELYRDYWGIPTARWDEKGRREETAWWRPSRKRSRRDRQ